MAVSGQHTTDKSTKAEKSLVQAARKVLETLKNRGHKADIVFNLSYFDIKMNGHRHLGNPPPGDDDRGLTIRPDGGVILVDGKIAGIFEDKYEGTADDIGKEEVNWAGGSTIDRTFKNVNACKMYCAGSGVFPYVVFAHGCNFHPKLKVHKRLEEGNWGFPNQMVIVTPEDDGSTAFENLLSSITPETVRPRGPAKLNVASIFIKTHAARDIVPKPPSVADLKEACRALGLSTAGKKADLEARLPAPSAPEVKSIKMKNGASDWTVEEYEKMILKVVEAALN
jgi:hypothetical protein